MCKTEHCCCSLTVHGTHTHMHTHSQKVNILTRRPPPLCTQGTYTDPTHKHNHMVSHRRTLSHMHFVTCKHTQAQSHKHSLSFVYIHKHSRRGHSDTDSHTRTSRVTNKVSLSHTHPHTRRRTVNISKNRPSLPLH